MNTPLGIQGIVEALDALEDGDAELAHGEADELALMGLEAAGIAEIADAWRRAQSRIGFWYA
jgi:hypothetical protein